MKKCKKCKKYKDNNLYNNNKNSDDGLNKHCMTCIDKYYLNKYKIPKLEYYKDNAICEGANYKQYIDENTEMSKSEKKEALRNFKNNS